MNFHGVPDKTITTMESSTESQSITIHRDGDLHLIAGGQLEGVLTTDLLVCFRLFTRHSNYYKNSLNETFAESKSQQHGGQDWEVLLPKGERTTAFTPCISYCSCQFKQDSRVSHPQAHSRTVRSIHLMFNLLQGIKNKDPVKNLIACRQNSSEECEALALGSVIE
ncbi:hypothetical protein BKA67DRAFT_113786 [Truncatella angustata]|uniref:Uncharacterized protein n=1 Tax=Truncatella angustata TaxID=152316 RepID=A0A9P8RK30_9PEZI|nr:uncharacterized protein BKA67DRAFT_113786 [Truncatella angustata]KAH6645496.1 hypothetical protein BKA67DRAFT_113786 [Truncatella angustata]